MDRPVQLSLLADQEQTASRPASDDVALDANALREIYAYACARLTAAAGIPAAPTVEREVGNLKRIARTSLKSGGPGSLLELSDKPDFAARLFREPGSIQRREVSARWNTFRLFIALMTRPRHQAARRVDEIERRLIPRTPKGWYQTDRTGGGSTGAGGRDSRILTATDLLAIAEQARWGKDGEHALRDHALVSLCCWSPLRANELANLKWEHLIWEQEPEGKLFPVWARCRRRGKDLTLPIHSNARGALAELRKLAECSPDRTPDDALFRTLRRPTVQLSVRQIGAILEEAIQRVGVGGATLKDLRAALADHLQHTHNLTELELTAILGYGEHKHTRNLLKHHRAWRLNEKVREASNPKESGADSPKGGSA